MKKFNLFGHTLEISYSGSGSIDPWSGEFARSINLGLWGTSDVGEFMLVDGSRIYKLDRSSLVMELRSFIDAGIFDSWEQFENEWLKKLIEKKHIFDWGTLSEHIEGMKLSWKRNEVWKSYGNDEKNKREVYEEYKKMTEEERNNWYERKFEELGIKDLDVPAPETAG